MRRPLLAPCLILASLLLSAPHFAAAQTAPSTTERVLNLPVHGGDRQRALYASPSHPRATIVMLPGGAGDVGIARDGEIAHGNNFVVRSRLLWNAAGFAVLIPDAVDSQNLRGLRSSPQYAALVGDLVAAAHAQAPGPVFLLGTSQGSIAAMNGAANLRDGQIAGIVLTESVSRLGGSHETVFDAHPERVNVPALVVANSDDRCNVAPPEDADRIAAAMSGAPRVKVIRVSGGDQRSSTDCGSLSPHGYYGIEQKVVDTIAAWIDAAI
ncbi:alpha/beta hydrolase [Tardiphaga sp. 841_E9_N1_2]|uniref:alpha/beta hydrolase n=1 Tax=Tardiphaga sp. 841_E9_N1_2 TaxID=3240762 RepID=UPI003F24BBA0